MLNKIKNASLAAAMALSMTVLTAGQAQAAAPIINDLMAKGDMPSLAPMLKKILPGVVNISVKGKKMFRASHYQMSLDLCSQVWATHLVHRSLANRNSVP